MSVQIVDIVERSHAENTEYVEEDIVADFEALASIWRYYRGTPAMIAAFGPVVDADGNAASIELTPAEICMHDALAPHFNRFATGGFSYISITGPAGGLLIFNYAIGNHRFCIVPSDTATCIYEIIFYKL